MEKVNYQADECNCIEKERTINTLMNSIIRWNNDGIIVSIYDCEGYIIATMIPKRDIMYTGEIASDDIHICIESNSKSSPFNDGGSVIAGDSYDIAAANLADIIISNRYKVIPLVHCCYDTLTMMEMQYRLRSGLACLIMITTAANANAEKDECIAYATNISGQNTFADVYINNDEGSHYKRWYACNRLIPNIKYYGGIEIGKDRYTISIANLSKIIKLRKFVVL